MLDAILVLAAIAYAIGGFRNGALVGALSFAGFFGGAALGAQLAKPLGKRLADGSAQVPVAIVCVLFFAMIGQLLAVWLAGRIRARVTWHPARQVDQIIGGMFSILAVLLVAWMVAVPIASSPFPTLAGQVRRSVVIRAVDNALPNRVRDIYSSLRLFIDRSGFPQVFGALQPTRIVDVPPADPGLLTSPVVSRSKPSVLKVRSVALSCDRGIEGSSFVYSADHLLTNAHVVAGANQVTVETARGRLAARVVLFDPDRDVAVLYVPGLNVKPLALATKVAGTGQDAIVVGYPEDGGFDVRAARIRDREKISGRDIYGQVSVDRDIYTIRSKVRVGNSGGPLLGTDGSVLGIVFASALDSPDTGFVLTAQQVAADAAKARTATASVATGHCTS
ncbi:MarP family serine protease [Jatrophihabitans telluris]|uniref:MarP family serine protease n=1 Tax=Jatrophihabitans telluris TaxID=2038343 RepID=A0ABY4QY11_9ACTN|nr:MarP family serine protease [Jatrophihabitans telluris]UQX88157.1 MarP family serine protease [Jatrophihabitans telluris]